MRTIKLFSPLKLFVPFALLILGILFGWLLRDWVEPDATIFANKHPSSVDPKSDLGATYEITAVDRERADAQNQTLRQQAANQSRNGTHSNEQDTIVRRFARLMSQNNLFEANRLVETSIARLEEKHRLDMGSIFTAYVVEEGIDAYIGASNQRKLESTLAAADEYSPSAQFFDVIDLASSAPFVALSEFDALAGYYQNQVTEEQLRSLESWLIMRTENRYRDLGDWDNLELWLQALVSRASDPSAEYSKLAMFYYEREQYAASLETLDKIASSGGLSRRNKELYDLNTQSIADRSLTKIPLQPNGEHYIVNIELNGRVRVPLLLDTGASVTSIDRDFAVQQNFRFNGRSAGFATAGGRIRSDLIDMRTLELGDRLLRNLELATIDFGAQLNSAPYFGLLGMDVLGQFQFYIDQRESVLHLWEFE